MREAFRLSGASATEAQSTRSTAFIYFAISNHLLVLTKYFQENIGFLKVSYGLFEENFFVFIKIPNDLVEKGIISNDYFRNF